MTRDLFIKSLISGLKIEVENNPFEYQAVVDSVENIKEDEFMDFYNECRSEKSYGDGMASLKVVAERYEKKILSALTGTSRQLAKSMYDKFYAENCAMTDYTQKNRDTITNDRLWFESIDYSKLKRADGTNTYTKQEIYVLKELGGGGWLLDIRFALNANDVVNKIEKIINTAIVTKYEKNDNAIESKKVMKMLRGAA